MILDRAAATFASVGGAFLCSGIKDAAARTKLSFVSVRNRSVYMSVCPTVSPSVCPRLHARPSSCLPVGVSISASAQTRLSVRLRVSLRVCAQFAPRTTKNASLLLDSPSDRPSAPPPANVCRLHRTRSITRGGGGAGVPRERPRQGLARESGRLDHRPSRQ